MGVTQNVTFPVQALGYRPARPGRTPNPATRQLVPEILVGLLRHHATPICLCGDCSDIVPPANLLRCATLGYFLTSGPGNSAIVKGKQKSNAKINNCGPGVGRCVLGHQPRCVSTIRLRPPLYWYRMLAGNPCSGFEGPTRVENEVNTRGLAHNETPFATPSAKH